MPPKQKQKQKLGDVDMGAEGFLGDDPPAVPAVDAPPPEPIPAPTGPKDDRFYYYWDRFSSKPKYPKISLTPSLDADEEGVASHHPGSNEEGVVTCQKASTSYKEASDACRSKVRAIADECSRLNVKFLDTNFYLPSQDALESLEAESVPSSRLMLQGVGSVKRVGDIFEKPTFFEDGAGANDVRQGQVGDCWWLSAVTALSGKPELLERICVARDEKVGVYGFVFYRDGEWISEVVDDRLCLRQSDDKWSYTSEYMLTTDGTRPYREVATNPLVPGQYYISKLPKAFREGLRKGSDSLYFSSCRSKNETWLPLLEKAYAKAHGDYQAIDGGFPGEGIEDLTGGVATYLFSEQVLDKDKLWSELMQVNKDFLFGCGSRYGRDSDPQDDEGFVRGHAYTVLEAREIGDLRLLKIRNPWGDTEWNGAWSDGSKEWTPEMMKQLQHTFGDDGIFWISYTDFLRYYPEIDRTRLFTDEWSVLQQWTSVEVPWTTDYLSTKFALSLKDKSPVVLVLSQPDDRYFKGLSGRYDYTLHFRLYKNGEKTYIARSIMDSGSGRSCSAELDLDAGDYTIYVKIEASRTDTDLTAQEVITRNRADRRDKLQAVGKSFDLVHAKGRLREAEREIVQREKSEARKEERTAKVNARQKAKKERERERKREERKEKEKERKADKAKAEKKAKRATEREKKKVEEVAKQAANGEAEEKTEKKDKVEAAQAITGAAVGEPLKPQEEPKAVESEANETKPEPAATTTNEITEPSSLAPQTSSNPSASSKPPSSGTPAAPFTGPPSETPAPTNTTSAPAEPPITSTTTTAPARITITVDTTNDALATSDEEVSEVEVSDVCDDDFEWDSEIDGSLPEDDSDEDELDGDDLYAENPWKAVCVVGMKVCYIGAAATIKVLRGEEK